MKQFQVFDPAIGDILLNAGTLASLSLPGTAWYVDGTNGSDGGTGSSWQSAFKTIQKAVNSLSSGATVYIAPGSYNETVTLARVNGLPDGVTFIAMGAVGIAPSATNANAVVNDCDDVTFIGVGMAANGTGTAFTNTGSRCQLINCKLENDDGTGLCAIMTLQTVAQRAAKTKGNGADCKLLGCEFAWAASGVKIMGTDQGAVTELRIQGCRFHDLDTSHILEGVGSGGSAAVTYASLEIVGNTFSVDEAGSEPTHFILLNANNANSGLAAGNFFPTAINGGLNLVSTKLFWSGNFMSGGISAAQPS